MGAPTTDSAGQAAAQHGLDEEESEVCVPGQIEFTRTFPKFEWQNTSYDKWSGAIKSSNGVEEPIYLNADVYVPRGSEADPPLLVLQHGGGGNKTKVAGTAKKFARAGYAVVAFTARGLGKVDPEVCSTGTPDLVGPDGGAEDIVTVLGWIRDNAESKFGVKIDTDNVGMAGGSYGGLHAWIGGVMKHQGEGFHIRAIAPLATGVDLVRMSAVQMSPRKFPLSNLAMNCIFRDAFSDNAADGAPEVQRLYDALDKNDIEQQDELVEDIRQRSVAWKDCAIDEQCDHDPLPEDLAVLMIHPWADGAFPVNASIEFFERIRTGYQPHERKLILGGWAHPSGYSTNHMIDALHPDLQEAQLSFMDCHLRSNHLGACDAEVLSSPISYMVPGNLTERVDVQDLPVSQDYYLEGSQLRIKQTQDTLGSRKLRNAYTGKPGSLSNLTSPARSVLTFTGPELTKATELAGPAAAKLFVQSNAHEFAISVRVYEASGPAHLQEKLITRGVYWFDGIKDDKAVREIDISIGAMAHVFAAGSKIRIRISNLDRFIDKGTPAQWALTWATCTKVVGRPLHLWTVPSYVDSTQLIHQGAAYPSRVSLPLHPVSKQL